MHKKYFRKQNSDDDDAVSSCDSTRYLCEQRRNYALDVNRRGGPMSLIDYPQQGSTLHSIKPGYMGQFADSLQQSSQRFVQQPPQQSMLCQGYQSLLPAYSGDMYCGVRGSSACSAAAVEGIYNSSAIFPKAEPTMQSFTHSLNLKTFDEQRQENERLHEDLKRREEEDFVVKEVAMNDDSDDELPSSTAPPIDPVVKSKKRFYDSKSKKSRKHKKRSKCHHHKKRRKKRRRHESSSSSSTSSSSSSSTESFVSTVSVSSDSSSSCDKRRKKTRKRKKSHSHSKAKHRSRHRLSSRESLEQTKSLMSIIDIRRNKYKFLKPGDYAYNVQHLVEDFGADRDNLNYDESRKRDVPVHFNLPLALTGKFVPFLYDENALRESQFHTSRYFNLDVVKYFAKEEHNQKVERKFRRREPWSIKEEWVPLSSRPFTSDDEMAAFSKELDSNVLRNITVEEFDNLKRARELSYEESGVMTRKVILSARIQKDPKDASSWIELIRLQNKILAKDEGKVADAEEPDNRKALYSIKKEMIKQAIAANPREVDLRIEEIKIEEEFRGPKAEEVLDGWQKLTTVFINSLKVWRMRIQMEQNDRTTFEVLKLLNTIDMCITHMVDLKDGVKVSHRAHPDTENFLVELIVNRCKLLIEAGFTDQAVSTLQALTEFHFFMPSDEAVKEIKLEMGKVSNGGQKLVPSRLSSSRCNVSTFKWFWELGVPRIGDAGAVGWRNLTPHDYHCYGSPEDEAAHLNNHITYVRNRENELLSEFKKRRFSVIEMWLRLDRFRCEQFWTPVRHVSHEEDIVEYQSRMMPFNKIEPLLFTFENKQCASEMIFSILHILGAVVPGIKRNSQHEILEDLMDPAFAKTHKFPDVNPHYENLENFLNQYFSLLAKSIMVDKCRVYCAKMLTEYKFIEPKLPTVKKKRMAIVQLISDAYKTADLADSEKALLCMHIAKLYRKLSLSDNELKAAQILLRVINEVHVWKLPRTERLTYLNILHWVCSCLPYDNDVDELTHRNAEHPVSKFDLLYRLGILGTTKWVEKTPVHNAIAREEWKRILSIEASTVNTECLNNVIRNDTLNVLTELVQDRPVVHRRCSMEDHERYYWLDLHEEEILLEFGLLFFYELYDQNFLHANSILLLSPLATHISGTPIIFETLLDVAVTRLRKTRNISPREYRQFLRNAVHAHPTHLPFLRNYLAACKPFDTMSFLQKYMGDNDDVARRIGSCGKVYVEYKNFLDVSKLGNDNQTNRQFTRLRKTLEKAAIELSTESSRPDAYLWNLLVHIEQDRRASIKRIDELFTLGQKQCPWSKSFLYQCARNRSSEDTFVNTLREVMLNANLQIFCHMDEIPLLLVEEVIEENDEEYLDDDDGSPMIPQSSKNSDTQQMLNTKSTAADLILCGNSSRASISASSGRPDVNVKMEVLETPLPQKQGVKPQEKNRVIRICKVDTSPPRQSSHHFSNSSKKNDAFVLLDPKEENP